MNANLLSLEEQLSHIESLQNLSCVVTGTVKTETRSRNSCKTVMEVY
jgi:hypothetical protein